MYLLKTILGRPEMEDCKLEWEACKLVDAMMERVPQIYNYGILVTACCIMIVDEWHANHQVDELWELDFNSLFNKMYSIIEQWKQRDGEKV